MEENPFPDLKISDFSFLNSTEKRERCPKCHKSRKYYCYTCYKPVNDYIADRIPKVKLPVKIDVIKHPSEVDGKSTSPHAAILAPEDVTIYDYPCIPTYDTSKTILIFPGPKSSDLEDVLGLKKCISMEETDLKGEKQLSDLKNSDQKTEYFNMGAKRTHETAFKEETSCNCGITRSKTYKSNSETCKSNSETSKHNSESNTETSRRICKNCSESSDKPQHEAKVAPWFDQVVFIDSTWNQTPTIANDERLKDIKRVEIKLRKTKFWRTQDGNPDEYLSTIEAIYYFLTDYHRLCVNPVYKNEYDNLLFFFCFNYNKIKQASGGGKTIKAYSKKRKKNEVILDA